MAPLGQPQRPPGPARTHGLSPLPGVRRTGPLPRLGRKRRGRDPLGSRKLPPASGVPGARARDRRQRPEVHARRRPTCHRRVRPDRPRLRRGDRRGGLDVAAPRRQGERARRVQGRPDRRRDRAWGPLPVRGRQPRQPAPLPTAPNQDAIEAIAFDPTGTRLVVSLISDKAAKADVRTVACDLEIWQMPEGARTNFRRTVNGLVLACAFSPDSRKLAYSGGPGKPSSSPT